LVVAAWQAVGNELLWVLVKALASSSVTDLDVSDNGLQFTDKPASIKVQQGLFSQLTRLTKLNLSHNHIGKHLHLAESLSLTHLNLSRCCGTGLREIPLDMPRCLPALCR
jgi:Leucine-rich repeat (LRR) protein